MKLCKIQEEFTEDQKFECPSFLKILQTKPHSLIWFSEIRRLFGAKFLLEQDFQIILFDLFKLQLECKNLEEYMYLL